MVADEQRESLGEKMDLFPSVLEVLESMVAGTHVFVDATTFSAGIVRYKYRVSSTGLDTVLPM